MAKHIIALGGGGFSMTPDNLVLDRYVLSLTDAERPKVCFLPQASGESLDYINRFYEAFVDLECEPTWFSLFGTVQADWREMLLEQDVIYVGGGNTKSMLALWRDWGVDEVLKKALDNGTILAGISAGAICWFEKCVTDSFAPLGVIDGLGMLSGSACPHYDGEADRRPTVLNLLENGKLIDGIALDDCAAAHYIDGKLHKVVTSREDARGILVSQKDGVALETLLETEFLAPDHIF